MSKHPYYYVEGIAAVSHSEGVFRVIFGQREGENEGKGGGDGEREG